ncbi:MAG: aminoacyl-histidine dipeptidase [Spirochaetales bacterium]
MKTSIDTLNPPLVWKQFAALSAIPRCSRDEEKVLAHLKGQFDVWGYSWSQDAVGNLVARKPASPGKEKAPVVILQSHVDMVCEQNRGRGHDFRCDPIDLIVDGEWLRANETTLGADNGIGVAMILAVLQDKTLVHGPLEALFTVDEETALTGALGLDPQLLTGKILLNLDSEEVGHFTVGCAGGITTWSELPVGAVPPRQSHGWTVFLSGLRGGHSGVNIHEQRGNALKLAERLASSLFAGAGQAFELAGLEGGDKHNAIPREALLTLAGPANGGDILDTELADLLPVWAAELGPEGKNLAFEVKSAPRPATVLSQDGRTRLLQLLAALPDGVQGMSKAVPGLVETSCNLASLKIESGVAKLLSSQRSSVASQNALITRRIAAAVALAGGSTKHGDGYPAWTPRAASPLRDLCVRLWEKTSGKEAVVELIHAGLECGVIGDKIPGMDMISFGPDIQGAHTPQERVRIESVKQTHDLLLGLLRELV